MPGLTVPPEWSEEPPSVPGYRTKDIPKEMVPVAHQAIVSLAKRSELGKGVLETFKATFAAACGNARPWKSTDYSFAVQDLKDQMEQASTNAVHFITGICEGIYELHGNKDVKRPFKVEQLNRLLAKHKVGFVVNDWKLETVKRVRLVVNVSSKNWELVHEEVRDALKDSQDLLARKQWRDAVQKSWWIIESASTVYAESMIGEHAVRGTYYNDIVKPLLKSPDNPFRTAVLRSLGPLQGILNDPKYGIRHGVADTAHAWQEREAQLIVNICHAYSEYILAEYRSLQNEGRIKRAPPSQGVVP